MKSSKILAYIQILAIVCLMVCNDGIRAATVKKSGEFPCKDHQCGCKSESDCEAHCCCGLYKHQSKFQNNGNEQKNSFQIFMSSVNCKYGKDPLTSITFTAKYVLENQVRPIKESFLCFFSSNTSICPPDAFVSPPEKPPQNFA